jgi:nucleoside-diphosphate-sugar epimerase
MKVVVTGASGFIGGHLCTALGAAGHEVAASALLEGADAVVHLANVAHRRADEAELRRVNVEGTARLAREAAAAGVRRFVYLSSVKVHGEESAGTPLREDSPFAPQDAYGRSKLEAERVLAGAAGAMETVILRPPLVYGPRVKANFLALIRAVARGWPLPLASVGNRRSLIYVGNLVDAILRCLEAPAAAGRTYLVSDGRAVSTPALCRALGTALDRPARLFACPPTLLELLPPLRKLTQSMEIDDAAIRRGLGWAPPFSFEYGVQETVRWYREVFGVGG